MAVPIEGARVFGTSSTGLPDMTEASDDALDALGRGAVRPVVVGLACGFAAMLVFGMSP